MRLFESARSACRFKHKRLEKSANAGVCILNKLIDKRNDITKNIVMNADYTKKIPDAWRNIAKVFVALGDEHRQRILLTFERGEHLNVGQIVDVSTLSRSAVSHHLKILREAGVLDSEKIGKEVYFWLNKKSVKESLQAVLDYMKLQ
jgi:ArsR family transcriptional regulator, arsenate/arsenite/antimonite-responsive transcriptional repressor